jgi:hypothetical protein
LTKPRLIGPINTVEATLAPRWSMKKVATPPLRAATNGSLASRRSTGAAHASSV